MTDRNPLNLLSRLEAYLSSWGLREFQDESSYYGWQRSSLTRDQLLAFERLLKRRSGDEGGDADVQFYDLLAQPTVLPVLYSQRYDYYRKIGVALCSRLPQGTRVLDCGCGVGILTTFFAQEFPGLEFVGIDRSTSSISIAEQEAQRRHVENVSYFVRSIPNESLPGRYDVILSTQSVFQAEAHPGLPSMGWQTFQRPSVIQEQVALEARTGLGPKLDALQGVLQQDGRMLFYEKTGHLGRRILFQRALSRRGFHLVHEPLVIGYRSVDEEVVDGPLYEVSQVPPGIPYIWNEEPDRTAGDSLYGCGGETGQHMCQFLLNNGHCVHHQLKTTRWGACRISLGEWQNALVGLYFEAASGVSALLLGGWVERSLLTDIFERFQQLPADQVEESISHTWRNFLLGSKEEDVPGYENHFPSAQAVFMALPSKIVEKEFSFSGPEGKSMHVEFGRTMSLTYLYWANTFDQRQLVLVDHSGENMLRRYLEDSLKDWETQAS